MWDFTKYTFKCPYCEHEYEEVVGHGITYKYENDFYDLFDYYEDNNGIGYGVRNWIVKENDTITGEVFNGTIKKNCTLIAHYMPCNKIKLNHSDTYIYGYIFEAFQLIEEPVLEGYTFIGWQDQFGTVITDFSNIEITIPQFLLNDLSF